MRPDLLVRIGPFGAACVVAYWLASRPGWFGWSAGELEVQLVFAAVGAPLLFVAAMLVQLFLTRRRGVLSVPADARDAWFQAGYYAVNGPVEEAFFRGLAQGGLTLLWGPLTGFAIATSVLGVPLGLAFWLLPGPPSLLGVSIAHIACTCGFLGPGPYLLKKLGLV